MRMMCRFRPCLLDISGIKDARYDPSASSGNIVSLGINHKILFVTDSGFQIAGRAGDFIDGIDWSSGALAQLNDGRSRWFFHKMSNVSWRNRPRSCLVLAAFGKER